MFGNDFTVKYITSRNCFLTLSEANIRKLAFQKVVKLTFDSKDYYCSCVLGGEINENTIVGIPSLYAKALGISEHQTVYITDVPRLPTLSKIVISPVSNDDFEILEISSETVQSNLLDQIRVVNKHQKVTIWISKWLHCTVNIDETDPIAFGYLANLSEVHILPPHKSRSLQNGTFQPQEIISKPEEPKFPDCLELKRLKKYLNIKKPLVYRVCPFKPPKNLTEHDIITSHPFNVFLFKQNVPKFITVDSRKEVTLCKISKIDAPIDFREAKEENSVKDEIIVRVCIIEDYYQQFSVDTKCCFEQQQHSDCKHPVIYIPEKTIQFFDLEIGGKILLGNSFEFQSDIRSVDISASDKKVKDLVPKFMGYLVEHLKNSKCLLNSDICIEIEENLVCSLKFNPPSEFCLFDEFTMRNCKFYQNLERHVEFKKLEDNNRLINIDDVCPDVCDLKNIVQQSESLLTMKNRNENILIVGKSGCGKSTIAKYIAQKLSEKPNYVHVVYVSCKKYKGKSVEGIHKIFAQDFQNMIYYQPSLLVLDDLHIICGRNESESGVQTQEALYFNRIGELLSELIEMHQKTNKISVISTTESTLKLNENVLSSRGKHLFRNVFNITELNKKHRELIIRNLFDRKVMVENNVDFDVLASKTEGYVMQDLVDFVNKSMFESFKRNVSETNEKPVITSSDIDGALSNSVALALRDVQLHSPGDKDFGDVGGLEDVKKMLVESMNWPAQYPDLFNNAPLRLQSGVLLYGPPGVGKTLLVGASARQCGLRLIAVKGPELLSKYIGASEQAVRGIFEKAESARPCILFFDEFDSLAPRRGHDSTGVTDRVVNQLLTQLDGVEGLNGVFVIAATSRPDLLDPALLRPGRLDRQILCPVPDQTARLSILKALSRNINLGEEIDLKKVAASTKGFSGADLQAVLYTAQLYAVEEALRSGREIDDTGVTITNKHMDDSLKGTGASLTKQEANKYNTIYSKFQGKNDIDTTIKQQKATLA